MRIAVDVTSMINWIITPTPTTSPSPFEGRRAGKSPNATTLRTPAKYTSALARARGVMSMVTVVRPVIFGEAPVEVTAERASGPPHRLTSTEVTTMPTAAAGTVTTMICRMLQPPAGCVSMMETMTAMAAETGEHASATLVATTETLMGLEGRTPDRSAT